MLFKIKLKTYTKGELYNLLNMKHGLTMSKRTFRRQLKMILIQEDFSEIDVIAFSNRQFLTIAEVKKVLEYFFGENVEYY